MATCAHCLPDQTGLPRAPWGASPSTAFSTSASWLQANVPIYVVDWQRADEVKEFGRVSTVIEKTQIKYEGRTFRFRGQPLFVVLEKKDDGWTFATDDPEIEGCADTPEEALDQLGCRVAYLWDAYACEDDARLGKLAQRLKRSVLRRVSVDDVAACKA